MDGFRHVCADFFFRIKHKYSRFLEGLSLLTARKSPVSEIWGVFEDRKKFNKIYDSERNIIHCCKRPFARRNEIHIG